MKPITAAELIAVKAERDAAALQAERAENKRAREALRKHLAELEARIGLMAEVEAAHAALPKARTPRAGRALSTDRRVGAALTVLSDWHVEEKVDPKAVQGMNKYTPEIARARAERCFAGIAWLIREQRATFDIKELYICALGDFITGYIHEELKEGNFMSPLQALMFWMQIFEAGVRSLTAELPDLAIRIAFRFGNHGRTTLKTQIATAAANSFEWAGYHLLRRNLSDLSQVSCQIDEGHHSVLEVYSMRIHLHHGDSIRSSGGIGGIDVPLNRAVAQWRNKYHTHLSIVGHFHRLQMGERLMTNGSLIGYGAYSDWLPSAEPEPAQQIFCVIDQKRGKTKNAPIWAEDK